MTKDELKQSMGVLFEYFNEKPNKAKYAVYWAVFNQVDKKDFDRAIVSYMAVSVKGFFPMPGSIKLCLDIADRMTPEEAWMACKSIVNDNWPDDPWKGITCPVMLRAARAVGYDAFDLTENLSFAKRDFIDNYTAIDKPEARERLGLPQEFSGLFSDFSNILEEK